MLHLSLLVLAILLGVLWLTRLEEKLARHRPSLKVEKIWTGKERRREERLPHAIPVLYLFPKTSKVRQSQSENVSGGGIQLVLPEKFSPGTELELEFSLGEGKKPFRVIGRVVWMTEIPAEGEQRLFRTGFFFVQMEGKESARLRDALYQKREG